MAMEFSEMCPRGLLALFLILLAFGRCLGKKVAVIAIMTEIHMEPDCKMIDPNSVKMLEAAYWMIDNVQRFSKNVTFEIEVRDICGTFSAVPATLDLLNKYHNGPDKLIGIVTASTSRKAIMISQTITSLPAEYHVIQVATKETVPELSNRDKYKNVFTVMPNDRTQIQMICDILVEFKWNYIALLYQDDIYGKEGAELLSQCAKKARIHIVVKLVINLSNLEVLKFDYKKISGSVIIAHHVTVKRFFEKDRFGRKMSFIMTETVNIEDNLFGLHSNGAFIIVQTAVFGSQKFEKHWKDLFNTSTLQNTVLKNPYFAEMIEELAHCSFAHTNNSCDMENAKKLVVSKMAKLQTTERIETALYALTSVLGQILETPCLIPNKCLPFYKEGLKALHKKNNYVFLKNQLGYQRMGILAAFNENRTLDYPPNWTFYQLYYRKKDTFTNAFFFEKAGSYSSGGLTLNTHVVPGYDNSGNEFPVSSVTCKRKFDCKEHVKTPSYIYKDGDIMFVGIVPIHDRQPSDLNRCGSIRSVSGVSLAEAMLFAIEKLNERRVYTNIFPGKKVGILILDSCASDIVILNKLFAVQRNEPEMCGNNLNCSKIKNEAIVYIGALLSQVSQAVSTIMTYQNTVQISYGSTSKMLSDRNTYPNFMRVCSSDDEQIKVILGLLIKFSWKYVSIIYKNDFYGISFKESFIIKSKEFDICLIRAIPYNDKTDIFKAISDLRKRPEARVVLLFLGSGQIKTFLETFVKFMTHNEFTFVGSEAWADHIPLDFENFEKIDGSFTLSLGIQENMDFIQYTKEKILNESVTDAWLQKLIEKTCYFPLSLDKRADKTCPHNYTLYDMRLKSVWIPFVIEAITAAAIGLNKSISQICNGGLVCPKLFKNIEKLKENIKNVKLKIPGGEVKVFNDNGDGKPNYNIFNIAEDTYVKVGQWTKTRGFMFNNNFQPPSWTTKCPNKKHCSECIHKKSETLIPDESIKKHKNYTGVLSAFVIFSVSLIVLIIIIIDQCHRSTRRPSGVRRQPEGENPDPSGSTMTQFQMVTDDGSTRVKEVE